MFNLKNIKEKIYLFHEGTYNHSYEIFGAHFVNNSKKKGVCFTLWAPNARKIDVVGSFNDWQSDIHSMKKIKNSDSIWTLFIPDVNKGDYYKYKIQTKDGKYLYKSDPYAFYCEKRPNTASIIYDLDKYTWKDTEWIYSRKIKEVYSNPLNIYEVHLGSWRKKRNGDVYTYRQLAHYLVEYVYKMGYTHIELLPIMEHPFDGSWGYQITGYYSPTSRYGTPEDFMYFIDKCHQRNIGVILDWVPAHFCKDDHGLFMFDGSSLYGDEDHPHWGTMKFDFSKPEVVSFLISNAVFWFEKYHIDGLRVDGVASMLYLNYGYREENRSNRFGGNGNLFAVDLFQKLNTSIFKYFPFAIMSAEDSTSWPMVTWPVEYGGLGFNYKWDMGWMNDTLKYMSLDPLYRREHHSKLTFSMAYAFSENFLLPLSHDEVVHGKKSLIEKMYGNYENKFAHLRVLALYQITHPGKKLNFMGYEFAQFIEWKYYEELDWILLQFEAHKQFHKFTLDLNHFYLKEKALWQIDHDWLGFQWIDVDNNNQSIIIFQRTPENTRGYLIVIFNFKPVQYNDFKIGVPEKAEYSIVFNSDSKKYGGDGIENQVYIKAESKRWHSQKYSITLNLPPLAGVILKKTTNIIHGGKINV